MVDVFPNVLAPKANRARSRIGAAFQTYFERYTPGHTKSSVFTLKRYSINTEYGITPWNAARLEVGVLLGILANIIPAIFYMIVHIFSNKELLQQIREELLASSSIASSSSDDHRTRTLKILTMRAKCNLLHATMKEVLRHHALGSSVRFVREDTLLDGTYLLKKGMVVQMPMSVLHSSRSAWGVDPSAFRPSRFLEDDGGGPTGGKRMRQGNNSAFRPFGGGPSMCPGRHLATLETMSFVAHMVLSFDMEPVDGIWEIPRPKQESMATNVFPPERDIRVRLWRRDSDGGSGRWAFDMS